MSDRDALLVAVCENPFCKTTKLVFADWLDENGECGQAMRWAVKNGRRPVFAPAPSTGPLSLIPWHWQPRSYLYPSAAGLPSSLLPRKKRPVMASGFAYYESALDWTSDRWNWAEFPTQSAAWNWFIGRFGEAMAKGKIGYRSRKKPK